MLLAAIAFGLIRQPCNDIGWHLATARVAAESGDWPVTNTFSHTHPDYPLDQQYPLLQSLLYGVFRVGGWSGLSILNCAVWFAVLLLFVRWGGSLRSSIVWHLPWMVGLFALQRRMILRPDMMSMLLLGCELLVIDAYLRRAGTAHHDTRWSHQLVGSAHPTSAPTLSPQSWAWVWLLLLPLIQLAWANSHQLFPLGLAVQGLLIVHLLLARWGRLGVDTRDRSVALLPVVFAFVASLAACLFTPLGVGIVRVMANTSGSLAHHRNDVQEFAYLWDRPWELQLAVACGALGMIGLWRTRRAWKPLEVGLWCGTLVMMLGAVRGLVFFGPVSVALFVRSFARTTEDNKAEYAAVLRWPALRGVMALATLLLAANVVSNRWVQPSLALGGTQPGLNRSLGDWPHEAVAFLRENPSPGHMINLPWSLGSPLIWELPDMPVFVDARLEAYPREFLVDCMAAERDDATLAKLIAEYQPNWIVANHRDSDVRARVIKLLNSGDWACVHVDTLTLILVREAPESQDYLQDRRISVGEFKPGDLLDSPDMLRARQRTHFAKLLFDCGDRGRALDQLEQAEADAGNDAELTELIATARREFIGQ